ncbi:MAG: DUF1631 family protein [Granulosicoccaceae bacterium]
MTSLKAGPSASGTPGKERRLAQRYALDLPASLYLDDNDVLSIAVKNFCIGGLYLTGRQGTPVTTALQQLQRGAEVVVESTLAGEQVGPLRMRARVVRHEDNGVGVAFVNPEPLSLQQIQNHIIAMASAKLATGTGTVDYSTIIQRCDQVVIDSIDRILDKFCSTVVDTLFDLSQDIKDIRTQNAYFNAMGVLNKSKASLAEWFTGAILKGLEKNDTTTQAADVSLSDISTDSLSLVEENDFEDWLAASGIVDSVFSQHRELLNDLHRRLSIIFDSKIDKNNNPYGPMLYANALQEALMQLGLEHVVNLAIYKVLNKVLISQLGNVYKDVNAILIEQGIQPEEGVILKKEESAEPETETETVAEPEAAGDTVKPDIEPESVTVSKAAGQTVKQDTGAEPQVSGTLPSEHDRQIISPTEALDLYDLVHDLRELRKTVSSSGAAARTASGITEAGTGADIQAGIEAGTGAAAEQQHGPSFSSDQIIDALTTIDRRGEARDDGRSIKERVVDALRKTGADRDMAIAEHDDEVIDVTTDIFDSMKHDLQVAAALKLWLEKLEIPLMKIALVDDTIFTDRKHIARDVINKIARLELTGHENESSVQASINQSLNWLVGLMNNEFDGSSTVFKRVDDQLDLLLQIQNKEYEKNVEKVAESSATNKALNEESEADKLISEEFVARDEKRKEALNRVRRLEEGDWVVFEVNTDDPSRVRVAWIARHTEKLVFVNLLGEKERTISMVELAEQLLEETAVIVDNADDPIMDRAQYSMLQQLHEKLLYETTHDQLTCLLNRREFEKHLKDLLVQSKANNDRHMLCYMGMPC